MNKKGPLAICDGAADGLAATDIEDCGDDIHSLPVTPFDKNVTAYGDLRRALLQTAFAACDPICVQQGDDHVDAAFALQLGAPQAEARGALRQRPALNGRHQQNKAMTPASQKGNDVLE